MKDLLLTLQNEKDQPCLSLIVPTYKLSPERELNQEIIYQAIRRAKSLIEISTNFNPLQIKELKKNINGLISNLDYNHLDEGLGIYASPNVASTVIFPYTVNEKIIFESKFDLREIFYFQQYKKEFLLLNLTKTEARLYRCNKLELNEIKSDDFPVKYEDDYEYSKPAISLSYGSGITTGFERDKSLLNEKRNINFLKEVDARLEPYLRNGKHFLISGSKENISNFEQITASSKLLAGRITGNYEHALPELNRMVNAVIYTYQQQQKKELINEIREGVGTHKAIIGLAEVWEYAYEGRGLTLILEKNFTRRGYIDKNLPHKLHFVPLIQPYEIIHDVANDLIVKTFEKGGSVYFLDDNELESFGHVAMLVRY